MNDDARFFFYLSGFLGFVFFFLFGLFSSKDLIHALALGTFGCLFFSVSGRFLLSFILKGIILDSKNTNNSMMPSINPKTSAENDPNALVASANSVASTKAKPLVQTQA